MTDKQKYNNLSSIDVYSLSSEELKIAIREWAEGDPYMEELLWKCYNNGIETKHCHAGGRPYIALSADNEIDKVKNMIDSVCDIDGFSALIMPDGGNAFSGDGFYKSELGIVFLKTMTDEEAGELFKKMISAIDKEDKVHSKIANSLIDLYTAFKEKESDLHFRFILDNNEYSFVIETNDVIKFDYFCILMKNLGLVMDPMLPGRWSYSSKDIHEIENKIEEIKKLLIKEYSFPIPTEIDSRMSMNEKFRILRRKYIQKDGNDLEFREFKNMFEDQFDEKEHQRNSRIITNEELWKWVSDSLIAKELEISSNLQK